MKAAVIINPISGAGGGRHVGEGRARLADRLLTERGIEATVSVTSHPGDARSLTQAAIREGAQIVFAWGGDGTVNEVASTIAFTPVALAIIPAGSGNGLARELGIARRPHLAVAQGLEGTTISIDAGELAGRLFFNVAGIGFDALVASRFNQQRSGRRGILPYVTIVLSELFRYRAQTYAVTSADLTLRRAATLIAIANSSQYGNRARIAPTARVDDGLLDLVIVEPRSSIASLWEARRLFLGTIAGARGVTVRRIGWATIGAEGPLVYHVDGEPGTAGNAVEVRVHPSALQVRIPKKLTRW